MQVNTFSNIASMAQTQVSNKKADDAKENTKDKNVQSANSSKDVDKNTLEKLNALGGKGITQIYLVQFQQQTMNAVIGSSNAQTGLDSLLNGANLDTAKSILTNIDFASLGYSGKNPLDMNTDELQQLVSEDGFFGIADFVIKGGGDDVEKLKKGLEGMKKGFEQAEKMWGGELPQISQNTIDAALKKVSDRIDELGGKTLDLQA
ncbi:TPA: hypothetical protein SFX49_000559 [Campylobacter jejuni]|nr:hypothetical protein [Campylobacter jejuni]